jgi:methionyl-tRNA synthetase
VTAPAPSRGVFYLTTPIYYVNATPHLGHAYTTIVADAMARYRRLAGDDVWFLTGTDEHGDKIAQAAAKAGLSPQAYADRISAAFRETWRRLSITHDDFIRTTEERHARVVRQVLQTLWDRGEIYFGKYGGHYCFGCERFYTEKEIVEGKCPDHQTPLTYIEEENYFFKMSKYQAWLVDRLQRHPDLIRPERYRNEILGFLREPLQDLSISRPRTRLEWGIPLPFDERFVTYVWFDALLNYVSALGGPGDARYLRYWPHVQHLIGKDILKPHGVYWPCMLEAAGLSVFAHLNVHGYWGLGGGKMSKSVGNVVEALGLTDKYGHDAFRYFLMREMVFGLDANFSEEALVDRLNADLANDLGNLVSRATTLIANLTKGRVPAPAAPAPEDEAVRTAFAEARRAVDEAMAEFAFQRALTALWEFVGVANRYVDAAQPWALGKDPARLGRLDRVLLTLADTLTGLGIVLEPFLPDAAGKIRVAVGYRAAPRLADAELGRMAALPAVERLPALFPRVGPRAAGEAGGAKATGDAASGPRAGGEVGAPQAAAGEAGGPKAAGAAGGSQAAGEGVGPKAAGAAAPGRAAGPGAQPDRIGIEEFRRLDLRVAEVLEAEPVPRSKKLLKLTVKLGDETRTLVAGIAEHYRPEALRGRKVVIVANLEPATLMGVESNGMVLAGSDGATLALLTPDRDLPPGARVT